MLVRERTIMEMAEPRKARKRKKSIELSRDDVQDAEPGKLGFGDLPGDVGRRGLYG